MLNIDTPTLKRNFALYITPLCCSLFILCQWMLVNLNIVDMHYRLTDHSVITLANVTTICAAILISAVVFLVVKTVYHFLLGNWQKFRMYFYTLSIYTVSLILAAHFYIPPQ